MLYRDPLDKKLVIIDIEKANGTFYTCIKKVIDQTHCIRDCMIEDADIQSTADSPLRFYEEATRHSCHGIDWHLDIPIDIRTGHIIKDYRIRPEGIDGMVQEPKIKEGVWLAQDMRKAIEERDDLGGMTPEQYVWEHPESVCYLFIKSRFETPFTQVFNDMFTDKPLSKRTKVCGYVQKYSDFKHLELVRQQFAEKVTDIQRLYPELLNIDLIEVMDYKVKTVSEELEQQIKNLGLIIYSQEAPNRVVEVKKTSSGIITIRFR